jgi:hypothetical protein
MQMPVWDEFFRKQRYSLVLVNDPDVGALSKYEIKKLQEIAEKYADCDEWEMVRITHQLPEWINNDPGDSCKPIPLSEILEAVGRGADAQAIIDEAKELASIQQLLGK